MKCPFCGADMRYGAIQTARTQENLRGWEYRWVPPADRMAPPTPKRQEAGPPVLQELQGLAEQVGDRWKRGPWNLDEAVEVQPTYGEKRSMRDMFGGLTYLDNAWYCPKCEKVLIVFERAAATVPQTDVEAALEKYAAAAKEHPINVESPGAPPPPVSEPKPVSRTKPRDDPWQEKGLFRRRKKPDWEK